MLERIVSIALSLFLMAGSGFGQDIYPTHDGVPAPTGMDATFRKSVEEVHLAFSVSSQSGRPVPNLAADQFVIYEDNRPLPKFTGFYADQNLPVHLLLMIDSSDSMTRGFAAERNAAIIFLRNVVRPGIDQSTVASFSTHLVHDPGNDATVPETLLRIGMLRSQGITALYDSLYEAAALFQTHEREHSPKRRVLVLLSDGEDNYSLHSLNVAIAAAQKSELVIYAIAAHNPNLVYPGDLALERITAETGARFFVVKTFGQAGQVFAEIEQEIRSQYSVTFRSPERTCGYHSLRVEPRDHSMHARSRAGFYGDC